jgi:hypothetical protein
VPRRPSEERLVEEGASVKPRRKAGKGRGAYEGQLAEPMYPPSALGNLSKLEWAQKRAVKTVLLLEHFGIDPNDENSWKKLAVALAERHVPGFMPPPRRGRPKQHDDIKLALLVELLGERDGLKIKAATDEIADFRIFSGTAGQLRERYKKRSPQVRVIVEFLKRFNEAAAKADGSNPKVLWIEALEELVENY